MTPVINGRVATMSQRRFALKGALLFALTGICLFCFYGQVSAGNPHSAYYGADSTHLLWFIHTSDTHIGASGTQDSSNLQWLVTTARSVLAPSFVVVTGDLTDSTNGNIFGYPNGPYQAEWDQYKSILASAGVSATDYFDLPGNHDAYNDVNFAYYRANSVQGRATGSMQFSWSRLVGGSEYRFLGVNTADNTGDPFSLVWPYGDYAGLDSTELGFITGELKAHGTSALTLIFGHHPLGDTGNPEDTYIYYGLDAFLSSLDSYGASLYGYGHTHAYSEDFFTQNMTEGVFYFNVASLGKSSANQYAITAIDCNGMSTRAQTVNTWPAVLITAPMDWNLGGGPNPYSYKVPNSATNPVRALVFDPATVSSVQFRADAGVWKPMSPEAAHVWQGTWDASSLNEGTHSIEVQAVTGSGTRSDAITAYVQRTSQPTAGVTTLTTGKYVISGSRKNQVRTFVTASTFSRGETVVIRATVKDATGNIVPNATVSLKVNAGSQLVTTLTSGPSDSQGIAEAQWKTSAPGRKGTGGTPTGLYTVEVFGVTATGFAWDGARTQAGFTIQ
jgi:hypothetical protein